MKRAITILLLLLSSCGSLRPAAPRLAVVGPADTAIQLQAVEGRPSGVVLRLATTHSKTKSVELYRVVTGGEPTLLQSLELDARLRDALSGGLEIVDSTVRPGEELTYQLFAVDGADQVIARSELAIVNWRPPPPRPADLVTNAPFSDVVEVSWSRPDPSFGAIIFRRDVLAGTGFERVALVDAPARDWVDRDVGAAGVWSYRVALARKTSGGFVQFGAPSEEVYASTPEAR